MTAVFIFGRKDEKCLYLNFIKSLTTTATVWLRVEKWMFMKSALIKPSIFNHVSNNILQLEYTPSIHYENFRLLFIRSLHGRPFAGRASNWESNKLGCYITMYSPITRSVVLRRRNWTIIDLLGNVFIHNAARSRLRARLSPQMAKTVQRAYDVM